MIEKFGSNSGTTLPPSRDQFHPFVVIPALSGRLDVLQTQGLKAEFKKSIELGMKHIVVDLGNVDFIDSSGISSLVSGLKYTREAGGWFRITGVSGQVKMVLSITKLDRVFEFYPDAETALGE